MSKNIAEWKCPAGHVMGIVRRNGRGIRQLLLYRQAISFQLGLSEAEPVEVEVMAVVEGYVADVRCSICGAIRPWVPGPEAMRKLLARYQLIDKTGDSV